MDLSTTNVWLAVIALSGLAQAVVVIVGAIVVGRRLARAEAAMAALATDVVARTTRAETLIQSALADIRPVASHLSSALDDLTDLAARARRAETEVRTALGWVSTGVTIARTAVVARAWPALGLIRGIAAGLRTIRARRAARDEGQDAVALARFVNEGGRNG